MNQRLDKINFYCKRIIFYIEKSIPIIFFIAFFTFGYWMLKESQKSPLDTKKEICLKALKIEVRGKVIQNHWSRGTFYSVFGDDLHYRWYCVDSIKNIIEDGDSIYKPSGTFNTYIYKNANPDSVIFVECDFDCDYWHKRYGEKRKNLGW